MDIPKRRVKRSRVTRRRDQEPQELEIDSKDVGATASSVSEAPTSTSKPAITSGSSISKPRISKPTWMKEDDFQRRINAIQKTEDLNESINTPMASEDVSLKVAQLPKLTKQSKDEIVRDFYNIQTHNARKSKRVESPIYRLRSFNNCIKYILIHKYGRHNGSVLDLGCGKGGDLAKWGLINTQQYVGIDLSELSVKEAYSRYRKSRYDFGAIFVSGDAFNTPLPEILGEFEQDQVCHLQFDNISMQFCMHYAFSSEESVRQMLTNVSKSLKMGGMFVGTIPSSDFIKWKIKKHPGEKSWGNSLYRVTFPDTPPQDGNFENPFGNVYNYFLVDAVDNVPEFIVPFEKFRGLCEEFGLRLRYKKGFFEVFRKEINNYFNFLPGPLVQSLRLNGGYGVEGEERDAVGFYLAFAFEKVA